jgi:carbamoyl-phosphate synthase large subunit
MPVPESAFVYSLAEAEAAIEEIGYPALVRSSFTLGGTGGGILCDPSALPAVVGHGLRQSPVGEVLIERSLLGWKEYELEVMRDRANNFVRP